MNDIQDGITLEHFFGVAEQDVEAGDYSSLQDAIDALSEEGGVVRPVYFPRFDGHIEWVDASGAVKEATFTDEMLTPLGSSGILTQPRPERYLHSMVSPVGPVATE